MFLLFAALFIVSSAIPCPEGYYGSDCKIHIPGTAHIRGVFEIPDCLLGFKNLDGFVIDYEVPKSLIPVVRTNCNEIMTTEARAAVFNSTYASLECTWNPRKESADALEDVFVEVHVRGIISSARTKELVFDKDFPDPFPVKVINTKATTVNVQLGWFDKSNVIPHLCAPTREPPIYALIIVLSLCLVGVLFSCVLFCCCLLKPEICSAYRQIFEIEEKDTPSKFINPSIQSSDDEFATTDQSSDEIDSSEEELLGQNRRVQARRDDEGEDDDLYDFDEDDHPKRLGHDPRDAFIQGPEDDLDDLMELSGEEDNEFSS